MADLSLTHHPIPAVIADPGRQTVTLFAYPVTLVMGADEARRFGDEWTAALGRLNVAHADKEVATA